MVMVYNIVGIDEGGLEMEDYRYRVGNFECGFYGEEEPLSSHTVLCDVYRNATTCVVNWCGNKCDLYQKDMSGKMTYIVIQSLESNGHCPYRKSAVYVI